MTSNVNLRVTDRPERSAADPGEPLRRGPLPGHLARGLSVEGEILSGEDLIVEGQLRGGLHAPDHAVTIAATATVRGRLFARLVSIEGSVSGEVVATGGIEIAAGARVEADLTAPVVSIEQGAWFTGRVDMRRAEAAARVARYRAGRSAEGRADDSRRTSAPAGGK